MAVVVDFGSYEPSQPPPPQPPQTQQQAPNLAFYQGSAMAPPPSDAAFAAMPLNPHYNPYLASAGGGSTAAMVPGSLGSLGGTHAPGSMGNFGGAMSNMGGFATNSHASNSFELEPPLLEELGVNFFNIQERTLSVLHPLRPPRPDVMAEADLAGPLLFCLAFGASLLASGKVHFGYIYGVATLGCLSLYAVLNLMTAEGRGADLSLVASTLGYCLLPMVGLSLVAIVLSLKLVMGLLGGLLTILCVVWCTHAASLMFAAGLEMHAQRLLVAYPCFLFYGVFALLTIF